MNDYLGTADNSTEVTEDIAAETSAWLYWQDSQKAVIQQRASKTEIAADLLMRYLGAAAEHRNRSRIIEAAGAEVDISEDHLGHARRKLLVSVDWVDHNATTEWFLPHFYGPMPVDPVITTPVGWDES